MLHRGETHKSENKVAVSGMVSGVGAGVASASGVAPASGVASGVASPLIVIAGGGTGGHVFPGLAVARRLESDGARVAWLVAGGMEVGILQAREAKFFVAPFSPPRAIGLVYAWRLLRAMFFAARILRRERAGAVLAMGGYASLPGGLAAALLRLPLIAHEQNRVAGKATKLLRCFARRTLGSFPGSPPGSETAGFPAGEEFYRFSPPSERYACREGALRLLVLGGSQGARDLNFAAPRAVAVARASGAEVSVVHQCGRGRLEETREAYRESGVAAEVFEFSSEVAERLAEADVVLCRAGASTLAEVAAVGVAALLAPYPFAAANHQERNADFFAAEGGAEKIGGEESAAGRIADFLSGASRKGLAARASRVHSLASPGAAGRIAEVCLLAARGAL